MELVGLQSNWEKLTRTILQTRAERQLRDPHPPPCNSLYFSEALHYRQELPAGKKTQVEGISVGVSLWWKGGSVFCVINNAWA